MNYGGPWAENYFYARENPHDNAKLRHFTPRAELDQRTRRQGAGAGAGPGEWFMAVKHVFDEQAETLTSIVEADGGREPRAAAGPRIPLGAVGNGHRRALQPRGSPARPLTRVPTRLGSTRTSAPSRPESSRTSSSSGRIRSRSSATHRPSATS